jgi:predicted phosphodiesterase
MKFLLTADFHLRADRPRCRADEDWIKSQKEVLSFISDQANAMNIPICIVGDIFDTPVVSDPIKLLFMRFATSVNYGIYTIAGNHDLQYHSVKNLDNSSFGIINHMMTIENSCVSNLNILGKAAYFDDELTGPENGIIFIHQLVFPDIKSLPPNTKALTAQDMLDLYPEAKWIFVGDYHQAFHYKKKGKNVVNPGCINIQKADYKDYTPSIYIVDTEEETVDRIMLPNDSTKITDIYLRTEEERETRISSFVESIKKADVSFDFHDNVLVEMKKNDLSERTKNKIMELLDL